MKKKKCAFTVIRMFGCNCQNSLGVHIIRQRRVHAQAESQFNSRETVTDSQKLNLSNSIHMLHTAQSLHHCKFTAVQRCEWFLCYVCHSALVYSTYYIVLYILSFGVFFLSHIFCRSLSVKKAAS